MKTILKFVSSVLGTKSSEPAWESYPDALKRDPVWARQTMGRLLDSSNVEKSVQERLEEAAL